MKTFTKNSNSRPFNTPIESGLRSLAILDAITPKYTDLQRLIYYDYLLVHSGDTDQGPESIHPSIPHRSGEWLVRRKLVEQGLDLMFSKGLVDKRFNKRGITYGATNLTSSFLRYLKSSYSNRVKENASWVAITFSSLSQKEIDKYMIENLGRWGAEFNQESLIREVLYE